MSLRKVAKELGVSPQAVSYTERMAIWKKMNMINRIVKFENAIRSYNKWVLSGKIFRPAIKPRPEDFGLTCEVGKMMASKVLDKLPIKL